LIPEQEFNLLEQEAVAQKLAFVHNLSKKYHRKKHPAMRGVFKMTSLISIYSWLLLEI
jgi:hypothetical protein